jgi:tetratricopeptide (TPR) repeat protein
LNVGKHLFTTITFATLLIFQTSAHGQNMSPSEFLSESHQADIFIGERHWDVAQRILLRLIATHHGRAHEYSQLAFCFLNALPGEEDFPNAEVCARKAIAMDPTSCSGYHALAQVRMGRDDFAGTIAAATKAIDCKKPCEDAVYLRARAYAVMNKNAEALKDFERYDRFISQFNKSCVNFDSEGALLEKLGRPDDAIKKYQADKVYHLEQATKNIVTCLQKQKKYPEAIAEISALIKRNPQDSDFYNLRGSIKAQAKDWKGAITDYNHAITIVPTSSYYKNRAQAYDALGQKDLAKKDLASAEKL